MFLDFYKLREQPFGVTPDPRFLFLGQSHREALASLHYGFESDRGFVALIAKPGLGKTTLAFQLLEKFHQRESRSVFMFQTKCNSQEFLHYVLSNLGADCEGSGLVSMQENLNAILSREMLLGRRFILAVDEAQNLDLEVLETIRLLSNFETSQAKLLQILLIGQPQLAEKLASPELEQLQQRISVFARLEPFGFEDTSRYVAHRLQVAGHEGSPLFVPEALRIIAEQSHGIPRKINSLCFSALSLGYAMGRKRVDAEMMQEVLADRDVESLRKPRAAQPVPSPPVPPYVAMAPPPPVEPRIKFAQSTLGAASLGVCVAIGIAILSFPMGRIYQAIRMSAGDSPAVRTSEQGSTRVNDAQTRTVIVKPGDTLAQIILLNMGECNENTIAQVRKLNPAIDDAGHIEVGEAIRIPQTSLPVASATARDGTSEPGESEK
jgi:type II secretory pathway predicted ATPase ExeA